MAGLGVFRLVGPAVMILSRGHLSVGLSGDFRSGRAGERRTTVPGGRSGSVRDYGVTNRGVCTDPLTIERIGMSRQGP